MSQPISLVVLRDGQPVHALPLGTRPVHIGRAPHNDLVLPDDAISWHHASVWVEGGRVWVRDLASRNGTTCNGERVRGAAMIAAGDRVQLPGQVELQFTGIERPSVPAAWLLEDRTAGLAVPARSDRLHIGSAADSDLYIEHAAERAATVLLHANGELWVGTDDGEFSVEPGQVFEVAGRRLRIIADHSARVPTREDGADRYGYALSVTLNGASGPEALLTDTHTGATCLVDADNRAVLLYLLARKLDEDRAAGVAEAEAGWCSDDEIVAGVWGRREPADANSLHVLVYRLRRDLKRAGIDPWFIEKRRKALRARLTSIAAK
jgi:hypothetical protein